MQTLEAKLKVKIPKQWNTVHILYSQIYICKVQNKAVKIVLFLKRGSEITLKSVFPRLKVLSSEMDPAEIRLIR